MQMQLLDEAQKGLSRAQVLNSIVVVLVALGMLGLGLLMQDSALAAAEPYLDEETGIRAQIPAGWLITDDDPSFVFQAEDPNAVPFKTLLRVLLLPVGEAATPFDVKDTLILERSARLSTFRVQSVEETTLGEQAALEMDYSYVSVDENPFSSAVPVVVRGRDVMLVRGRQALVISYVEERSRFDENDFLLENFLERLEF